MFCSLDVIHYTDGDNGTNFLDSPSLSKTLMEIDREIQILFYVTSTHLANPLRKVSVPTIGRRVSDTVRSTLSEAG